MSGCKTSGVVLILKKVRTNLKTPSLDDVKTMNIIKHVSLKPGEKLCFNCFKTLNEEAAEVIKCQAESSESLGADEPTCTRHLGSSDEFDEEVLELTLNKSFSELGISPIKPHRVSEQNKPAHMKRKISQVTNVVITKVAKVLHI